MGFKWFKARMRMDRMPAHSSAVAGIYRPSIVFDVSDLTPSVRPASFHGNASQAPKTTPRPLTMPALNNPMAIATDDIDDFEFVNANYKNPPLLLDDDDELLVTRDSFEEISIRNPIVRNDSIRISSGDAAVKPNLKARKAEYKKAKGKAPAPMGHPVKKSTEFITISKERKDSNASDIDV